MRAKCEKKVSLGDRFEMGSMWLHIPVISHIVLGSASPHATCFIDFNNKIPQITLKKKKNKNVPSEEGNLNGPLVCVCFYYRLLLVIFGR